MSGFHPEPGPGLASNGHPSAEPSAAFTPGPWHERAEPLSPRELSTPTEFMLASIAISLKRIADALGRGVV